MKALNPKTTEAKGLFEAWLAYRAAGGGLTLRPYGEANHVPASVLSAAEALVAPGKLPGRLAPAPEAVTVGAAQTVAAPVPSPASTPLQKRLATGKK